jgi:ribosomal protein S27E
MRCECCGKFIHSNETAHGIKHGTININHNLFLPDKDSAYAVTCARCGERLLQLIYSSSNQPL